MSALDELIAYIGPDGTGCRKPCPGIVSHSGYPEDSVPCALKRSGCELSACPTAGIGYVLDAEHPMFKALWQVCPGCLEKHNIGAGDHCGFGSCFCDGSGYAVYPRAEAALRLESAVFEIWPDAHIDRRHGITYFLPDCIRDTKHGIEDYFIGTGESPEGLAAAVLAYMKQEVAA